MRKNNTPKLLALLVVLFIGQGFLQRAFIYPKWLKDYAPKGKVANVSTLNPDQFLFALAGFREMIAGILWVRADAFFDTGNYDAILPIIRLVTILDPHQIDVYATGMWHIGYNFTDEEQRSDRRYIPSALALGKEGTRQNPETYELFFETGWMWYHKIDDDYDQAVKWFEQARERKDMLPARKNLLAMALQRAGKPDQGLETYFKLFDAADEIYKKDQTQFSSRQIRETLENNIDTTLVRMAQRGFVASQEGRSLVGYDVNPPFDVGFSVKATVVEPMVLRFEGTWNVQPVGTRIRVVLRDEDYPEGRPAGMNWDQSNDVNLDPPKDRTYMQDGLFVRNRRFNRKIDLSKDPTMYPVKGDKYVIEFYYNPRSAPPHIQDKFSWNGEGLTDKNFLNTEVRPGQRVVFYRTVITRDQLKRRGDWETKTPVIKSPNYVEPRSTYEKDDTVLEVNIPALRSGG